MAKVKKFSTFCSKPSGGYQTVKVDIHVDTKGMFYAKIPDELLEYAESFAKDKSKVSDARIGNGHKIFATTLEDIEKFLSGTNRLAANDSVKSELVILYAINNQVSYYKLDGKILENAEEDDHNDRKGTWFGGERGNSWNNYSVQVYAKVVKRTTQTNSDTVNWDRPDPDFGPEELRGEPLGEYGEKLNSFLNLGWPKDFCHDSNHVNPEHCTAIKYTEERAKFFYDMLIGMCKLADKFSVLQDEKVLLKLADSGKFLLMSPEEKVKK